jgi:hypothetical protein
MNLQLNCSFEADHDMPSVIDYDIHRPGVHPIPNRMGSSWVARGDLPDRR